MTITAAADHPVRGDARVVRTTARCGSVADMTMNRIPCGLGHGDVTATSQAGRLVVTAQMILDLLALGLGTRVFAGGRSTRPAGTP
jgi:hypothetical protein